MPDPHQVSVAALLAVWPEPALWLDSERRVRGLNSAALAVLGDDRGEVIGLQFQELGLNLVFSAKEPPSQKALLSDGPAMDARWVPLAEGITLLVLCPPSRLAEHSALLQNALDSSQDMIFVKDVNLRTIFCNQAFAAALGKQPQDLFGKTDLENGWDEEHIHGNSVKGIRGFEQDDREALNGATVCNPADPANVGGSVRTFDTVKLPLRDKAGQIIGILGVARDVTDRVAMELNLLRSEERFRRMMSAAPVAFALNDEQGRITYLNETFIRTFGYTLEDIPNLEAWWPRAYPDPAYRAWVAEGWQARLQEAKASGKPFQPMELEIRCKNGEVHFVQAAAASLEGTYEGNHLVSLVDLTDQKRAEEERRQFELHIQHTQKLDSLGTLASGVAHDMNNVLAAILGIAELHHALSEEEGRIHQDMATILMACTRGRSLVQGLVDFARKGLGELQVVDLNHLVQEEVALLERTTLQKVHCQIDLDPSLQFMEGDPGALSHALMNLCVNAVQAMPGGGNLTLRTRNEGANALLLEVEDTGSGMAPEVVARAVDPFFTTKAAGEGTGLGLSMVYGTVKAHGGSMSLTSVPGQGTRVTLRFKALEAVPDPPSPNQANDRKGASGLRVLIVDDDDLVQAAVAGQLEVLGHQPRSAESGLAALSSLEREGLPDVVLLDVNMPGMDGFETLNRIRASWPDLQVLMISGRMEPKDMARFGTPLKARFIAKPFSLEELKSELEQIRREG